jgi:predicted Fe-Mo cluster-binding NifX family protein
MKIAFPSSDGKTISAHFGSAPIYVVFTIEDQKIILQETRQNQSDAHSNHEEHKHNLSKFELLSDCQTVIAGGMGENAFLHLKKMDITVFLVQEKNIHYAISSFLSGKLIHEQNRLHKHHPH